MNICVSVLLAAAGAALWADELDSGEHYRVSVCLDTAGSFTLNRASSLVSKIYASIAVEIDWWRTRNCPPGAIRVTMQSFTFPSEKPDALAYSMPYGTRIVIFYDRVQQAVEPRRVPALTAHAIAHEIGHILERNSSHSASGVMKARWNEDDFSEMVWKLLRSLPRTCS
jgi:hypothetical protein